MTTSQDPIHDPHLSPEALRAQVLLFSHKSRASGFEHTADALEDIFVALLDRVDRAPVPFGNTRPFRPGTR